MLVPSCVAGILLQGFYGRAYGSQQGPAPLCWQGYTGKAVLAKLCWQGCTGKAVLLEGRSPRGMRWGDLGTIRVTLER